MAGKMARVSADTTDDPGGYKSDGGLRQTFASQLCRCSFVDCDEYDALGMHCCDGYSRVPGLVRYKMTWMLQYNNFEQWKT